MDSGCEQVQLPWPSTQYCPFACGKLAVGAELKFSLAYQPKDAGNFKYVYRVANDRLYLPEADGKTYDYSWTQAVLAG